MTRNRSGERRWDNSPYSDRSPVQPYYSSSLVTSYLSPPPESRWRRTSSDSAIYQKPNNPPTPTSPNQKSSSEQGSPEYSPASEDIKPPPELLQSLLRDDHLHTVKEEPGMIHVNGVSNVDNRLASPGPGSQYNSGSSSPVVMYPPHQSHQSYNLPPRQQNNLEEKLQNFHLDCPSRVSQVSTVSSGGHGQYQEQDSGSYLQHNNPSTPTTGDIKQQSKKMFNLNTF